MSTEFFTHHAPTPLHQTQQEGARTTSGISVRQQGHQSTTNTHHLNESGFCNSLTSHTSVRKTHETGAIACQSGAPPPTSSRYWKQRKQQRIPGNGDMNPPSAPPSAPPFPTAASDSLSARQLAACTAMEEEKPFVVSCKCTKHRLRSG